MLSLIYYPKKLYIGGLLEYIEIAQGSWFSRKGVPIVINVCQ